MKRATYVQPAPKPRVWESPRGRRRSRSPVSPLGLPLAYLHGLSGAGHRVTSSKDCRRCCRSLGSELQTGSGAEAELQRHPERRAPCTTQSAAGACRSPAAVSWASTTSGPRCALASEPRTSSAMRAPSSVARPVHCTWSPSYAVSLLVRSRPPPRPRAGRGSPPGE